MKKFLNFIKNMFSNKKKIKAFSTADLSKGFYPEILFLINYPYAEYVYYKEI